MRVREVADRLGLPSRSVYRLAESGALVAFNIADRGTTLLIVERSVETFIAGQILRFQLENGTGPAAED